MTFWSKDYDGVEVDTAAWNTAIPEADIIDSASMKPHLKWTGTKRTWGLGFDGLLDIYEANLLVGEESDPYVETSVLATPEITNSKGERKNMQPVLGREIISQYKWEIDYKASTVRVTKYGK
jgi:hypothetical protein